MERIRKLAAAMLLQAVKDYVYANEGNKKAVINDLKSDWCDFLTEGMSLEIADKLLAHPEEIEARLNNSGRN